MKAKHKRPEITVTSQRCRRLHTTATTDCYTTPLEQSLRHKNRSSTVCKPSSYHVIVVTPNSSNQISTQLQETATKLHDEEPDQRDGITTPKSGCRKAELKPNPSNHRYQKITDRIAKSEVGIKTQIGEGPSIHQHQSPGAETKASR
ncbi:hypothetical protein M9H77_07862 [Catharanthus roseus]|uniref:Uncharacterized protein n=1 Tax=Catharanthus roseus TaxID=4058 RepID=A0ACC0BW38_CATRO|nr:hypothetical protein M9H77_07862 [Catharanthus roseus]